MVVANVSISTITLDPYNCFISAQRPGIGKSFPGLNNWRGFHASRTCCITRRSTSLKMRAISSCFSIPTPCSPVIVPLPPRIPRVSHARLCARARLRLESVNQRGSMGVSYHHRREKHCPLSGHSWHRSHRLAAVHRVDEYVVQPHLVHKTQG